MRIGYDVHDHRTEDGDGTSAEPPRDSSPDIDWSDENEDDENEDDENEDDEEPYDVHGDGTSAEPPRDPRDTATDCPEVPEEWDR